MIASRGYCESGINGKEKDYVNFFFSYRINHVAVLSIKTNITRVRICLLSLWPYA